MRLPGVATTLHNFKIRWLEKPGKNWPEINEGLQLGTEGDHRFLFCLRGFITGKEKGGHEIFSAGVALNPTPFSPLFSYALNTNLRLVFWWTVSSPFLFSQTGELRGQKGDARLKRPEWATKPRADSFTLIRFFPSSVRLFIMGLLTAIALLGVLQIFTVYRWCKMPVKSRSLSLSPSLICSGCGNPIKTQTWRLIRVEGVKTQTFENAYMLTGKS